MPDLELPILDEENPLEELTLPETEALLMDDDEPKPAVPEELNLLPLRDSVIYPMLIAPLSVGRDSSVRLLDESVVGTNRVIGVVAQRKPQDDNPGFDDVYDIGCAVIIRTLVKMPDAVRLIVQGVSRFRIIERLQEEPYLRARVEVLSEPSDIEIPEEELEALKRSVAALFDQAVRLSPNLPDELRSLTQAVQETNTMADLVAAHMPLAVEDKQKVLETLDVRERLRALLEMLGKEVRVLELSSKVQSEVSTELSKTQRDYYLREQLKAIQRELGEIDDRGEELEELRTKIDEANMPEVALKEVNREYDRLRRMNPGQPEYTVARTYVDAMVAMPWSQSTVDHLVLSEVKDQLDADHYGLEKIKDRIIEFLAVRKVKTDGVIRQPILCLTGPPGVGKTSLGRSIATSMGRKYSRVSLGGMRDEAEIRGHRRTYIGAMPGQIMQALRRVESNNPVIVLDEIDKLANDYRGDPSSALLEVLDPEQNSTFRDHYLDVPFDLSRVFFITTANNLDTIPAPLRDRMEVIQLGGYTEVEKAEIAMRHLVPKQIEEHGLTSKQIVVKREAIEKIVRFYTREAGVRNLEREIGAVVRKATRMVAEGHTAKITVNPKFVETALGAPRYIHDEVTEREMKPGTAVGLAWTPVGGDVLFIETAKMPGHKGLIVTGQLGDVMKESVTAALSYVRSHADELHINPDFYEKSEIHVHVPAGAVPKDGPSAGVTMLTALTSLLSNRKVKDRLAMTGEISLTGQVLPVGGIKEKVLAAQRAGVETLILPEQNQKDYLEDVPKETRDLLKTHFVKHADQVLKLALERRTPS
ncbi:endopeptidase La [soil metagenome]